MAADTPSTPATNRTSDSYTWTYDCTGIDWKELSELYRPAPLGEKTRRSTDRLR